MSGEDELRHMAKGRETPVGDPPASPPSPPIQCPEVSVQKPGDDVSPPGHTGGEARDDEERTSRCASFFCRFLIFRVFCFISGQYINVERAEGQVGQQSTSKLNKKLICLVAGLILFALQVIFYLGHVGTALAVEACRIGNVNLTTSTNSSDQDADSNCILPQEHWKFSTAITVGTIASFLSYSSITCLILIPVSCILCKRTGDKVGSEGCCKCYKKVYKYGFLSPYDDDTKLTSIETCCFAINYAVVLILSICSFISSVVYADSVYNQDECWLNKLNFARIAIHLSSQFCAIQSCFIFSKIVYKVTAKLNKLVGDLDQIDKNPENSVPNNCAASDTSVVRDNADGITGQSRPYNRNDSEKNIYSRLQKADRKIIQKVKPTLDLFGVWFIFHWVSYALTTMLLSAFIIQIILDVVQYNIQAVDTLIPVTENDIRVPYMLYVVFFTLVHAYLFLYPCFRAAAIGAARARLIHIISNSEWKNIPPSVQSNFIQYLKVQKFAFRVPLFCANIDFEFNWVYVSFFIAICGAYLKF